MHSLSVSCISDASAISLPWAGCLSGESSSPSRVKNSYFKNFSQTALTLSTCNPMVITHSK
jgi:hypothetical protein